jgi:GR25 family glycosyltransferase involved in LPS biosynthesis
MIAIRSYLFFRSYSHPPQSLVETTPISKEQEPFENQDFNYERDLDFYVITMKKQERIDNINKQREKLQQQNTPIHIELVDAVAGVDLNIDDLIKQGLVSPKHNFVRNANKEIGCYMSHLKIHQMIQEKNKPGYSVIFEDDFSIDSDQFIQDIQNAIQELKTREMSLDVLYLGNHYILNNGIPIKDKLHDVNKNEPLIGTHAMLFNNQSIPKIINAIKPIEKPVDIAFTDLFHSDKYKVYVMNPNLVSQSNFASTIDNFQLYKSTLKPASF